MYKIFKAEMKRKTCDSKKPIPQNKPLKLLKRIESKKQKRLPKKEEPKVEQYDDFWRKHLKREPIAEPPVIMIDTDTGRAEVGVWN